MGRPKVVTAPKILVYVNGKLIGVARGFNWGSNTANREISTIDIVHPIELAPTRVGVSWSLEMLRTIGDGGAQGIGMVAQQAYFSREKYFTMMLVERTSGYTLFRCDYCKAGSEQWQVSAKGLLLGSISGSGILWTNEVSS